MTKEEISHKEILDRIGQLEKRLDKYMTFLGGIVFTLGCIWAFFSKLLPIVLHGLK